jgi:hypothetical protein
VKARALFGGIAAQAGERRWCPDCSRLVGGWCVQGVFLFRPDLLSGHEPEEEGRKIRGRKITAQFFLPVILLTVSRFMERTHEPPRLAMRGPEPQPPT